MYQGPHEVYRELPLPGSQSSCNEKWLCETIHTMLDFLDAICLVVADAWPELHQHTSARGRTTALAAEQIDKKYQLASSHFTVRQGRGFKCVRGTFASTRGDTTSNMSKKLPRLLPSDTLRGIFL